MLRSLGVIACTVLSLAGASEARAQTPPSPPAGSALFDPGVRGPLAPHGLGETADTLHRDIGPTYWQEGALIGAGVGALGGLLVGQFICEQSESRSCGTARVTAVLVSAALLALPGALIGGQFSKHER